MHEEHANWQAVTAYMRRYETVEAFLKATDPAFAELLDDWAVSRVRLMQAIVA